MPQETRQQILDAAMDILREGSYRDLGIDAVMGRTGHTRTVFYRHFEDIPTVVLTLIAEVGGELVAVGDAWAHTPGASPKEARAQLSHFVDFYVRHGPLVRAAAEASHHDARIDQAYGAMIESFVAMTASAIEQRMAEGALEPVDAPQIARALVRMLNGYLGDTLGRVPPTTDPERVLETVWTVWTRTLFPAHVDRA